MTETTPYTPAADFAGVGNYIASLATANKTNSEQRIAQQNQALKMGAYNALIAAYGPTAGDPVAAAQMQEVGQRSLTNPIAVQQAQAGLVGTQQTNAFNAANDPQRLQAQALANTGAAQTQAFQAQDQPGVLALQRADVGLKGAQAGAAGAQAGYYGAETGKTNIEAAAAAQALAFSNAADVTGSLMATRDAAVKAGATDGGAGAIAGSLPTLIPALTAAGVPVQQAQALARSAVTNPAVLDNISDAAKTHYANIALSKGNVMLTPQALAQAAQNYQQTGQPTIGGMGGAKVNTAVVNAAAATPGGITGVPAAAQQFKSTQDYKNELADTNIGKVGGKLVSVNAIAAHTDLMEQFAGAIAQGKSGLPAVNAVQAEWQKQTGSPMPTNFDAQKTLLSGEMTRYLTSRGDVHMTEQFEKDMARASSLPQVVGVLDALRSDMGAQLGALRQQATAYGAASQFDKQLTPAAQKLLTGASGAATPVATSFQQGQTATGPGGQKIMFNNGAWGPAQ